MHEPTEADWLEGNDPMTTRERFEDATNNEYTPTTDDIREAWAIHEAAFLTDAEAVAQFDQWLADVIAEYEEVASMYEICVAEHVANNKRAYDATMRAERAESKLTLLSGIAMRMAAHVEAKYDDDGGLDNLVRELRAALYRAGA